MDLSLPIPFASSQLDKAAAALLSSAATEIGIVRHQAQEVPLSMAKDETVKYSTKSTDEELVAGCLAEHRLAQKSLYERYFGKMMSIAMRYAGNTDEAHEILNLAFLKVFQSFDKYEAQGNLGGWIARIVFNSSIDYVRRNTSYKKNMDFNIERDVAIASDALQQLQAEDLYKLIQLLPPATRTVFSLYVLDGYTHQEIADLLNISVGTSKWHLSTARTELKERIERLQLHQSSL